MKLNLVSFLLSLNLFSLPSFVSAEKHVVGYYVPWGKVEPEQVDWKKLTHVNYGFGVLYKKNDPTSIFVDRYYDGNRIRKVQKLAKANGVKSLISLGGWTGGQTFSIIAKDPALRKQFINNALLFVRKNTKPEYDENPDGYELDGIDIDWEYPAREAAKCNAVDPNDTANYLVLLKELREAMDKEFPNDKKLLTAAVRVQPFDGPNGKPISDVSEFAKYFDFINIMIYDIMGGWSATTGPNAPFDYDTSKGGDPFGYRQAIDDWLKAGFPADKLVAGLAFYGRSTTAKVDMNATPGNQYVQKDSVTPKGDPSDANDINFFCNEGSFYSGVWKWKYLRSEILKTNYKTPVAPWTRSWDNTTRTPYLFNSQTKQFISYDDPESLKFKVDHAKAKNLKGLMYWDIAHDVTGELLNVVQGIRDGSNPQPTTTTTAPATTSTSTSSTSSKATTVASSTTTSSSSSPITTTSSSSNPITTTTSSSSNPTTTTTTTTTSSGPGPTGGPCQEGTSTCVSIGKLPAYKLCLYGKYIDRTCGAGTACYPSGNSITCGFPSK